MALLLPSPVASSFPSIAPTSSPRHFVQPNVQASASTAKAVRAQSIGFLAGRLQARAARSRPPLSPLRITFAQRSISASAVLPPIIPPAPVTPRAPSFSTPYTGLCIKRSHPGTPESPTDASLERSRHRHKVSRTKVRFALPAAEASQGWRRNDTSGVKESVAAQVLGKEKASTTLVEVKGKAQSHRLRIVKGMSSSTASGRVRPRLSLSLDTASQTPSTAAAVSVYPTAVQSDMPASSSSSSPVICDQAPLPLRSFSNCIPARQRASPPALHPISTSPVEERDDAPSFFHQPPSMKRSNPKRLSLSLAIPATPAIATATTAFTTPAASDAATTATEYTPYTPGPPMTPGVAMSVGRAATKPGRRPNLMSLITQPPTNGDVPPTPGGFGSSPFNTVPRVSAYATMRDSRRRSNTAEVPSSAPFFPPHKSRSAYPRLGCDAISEAEGCSTPSTSTTHSRTDSGYTASTSTTNSSMPPPAGPYADGPVELVPGVYLGSEDSLYEHTTWASTSRVRILNVAQEVDDPWTAQQTDRKGKAKVLGCFYPADPDEKRPEVEYRHLMWGHGESGLAEVDESIDLGSLLDMASGCQVEDRDAWRFWEAIQWIEEGRRRGERVLIHCQCGVSRSATLSIAYLMALAAAGIMPDRLGHLTGMQDTYAFVKAKSGCIGPNVSLVFQLVEFARNLTALVEKHLLANPKVNIDTAFPTATQTRQSEADWARQRAAFDQDAEEGEEVLYDHESEADCAFKSPTPLTSLPAVGAMSIVDMKREADELDEAMRQRRLRL